MLYRRLTALFVGLLVLPSMVIGGGTGCVMRGPSAHGEQASASHQEGHHHVAQHDGAAVTVAADAGADDSSAPLGHSSTECVLVACATAVLAAQISEIDSPAHLGGQVVVDARLAPDSPAPGLDPPPPRA